MAMREQLHTHSSLWQLVLMDINIVNFLCLLSVCHSTFIDTCCGAKSVKLFIYCPNWEELRRFLFVLSIWTVTQSVMFAVFTIDERSIILV